uniref:Uncharacterized protein n=1 Tax=Oryza nivara TaxID=4536 RepID=A0A0E0GQG0_ORYNI
MDAEVRNSLMKEPTLHDAIKIVVTYRKQELLQLQQQNNDLAEPEVVIVEDDEVVIEPVPKKKRTGNKGFTIPPGVEMLDYEFSSPDVKLESPLKTSQDY